MPSVNHEVLRWARETAGIDLEEASRKLSLRPTKELTAKQRLEALESGEAEPTRPLLEKMAKQYRRPLLVFYMSAPPVTADRGEDYRTLPEDQSPREEALLDALIRDVRARQSMIRSLMEEEDEAPRLSFIGASRPSASTSTLATRVKELLGFDLTTFQNAATPEAAFVGLRELTERSGVFVLLIGDLGSHHTSLDVATFRGISLSDPVAPVIVINDHDARSAWSFTLIHELVHLCLGQSGVSGPWSEVGVEQLCNDVASDILLPTADLERLALPARFELTTFVDRVGIFARECNVSGSMVAYRLHRRNRISERQWLEVRSQFREYWQQDVSERKQRNRESEAGPDYYVVRRHRIGSHLIRFVDRMLQAGALTTIKAGRVLGVKASNVHSLLDVAP